MKRTAVSLCIALCALLALAPAASARRVSLRSATEVLPFVNPEGKLRKRERFVKVSARTAKDAKVEAFLQVFCFNRKLKLLRRTKTFKGTGRVTGRVRNPRRKGYSCSASASVRVTSRPTPPQGNPPPIRLSAALYATRR